KPTRVEQRTPYAASPIVVPRAPAKPAAPVEEEEDIWADVPKPQPPASTVPDRDEMAELAAMANEVMGAPIRGSDEEDDEQPTKHAARAPLNLPASEKIEKLERKKPPSVVIPEAPSKKPAALVVDTPPPVLAKPAGLPAMPPGSRPIPSVARATPPAGV